MQATPYVQAPNQFIDVGGRTLAYRSVGSGKPILLCTRFRGSMDAWDPAFIDLLVAGGMRAITFDYTGWGLSGGERTMSPLDLARDARDLLDVLDLHDAVICGWSLGGMVAQVTLAMFPQRISHCVLIATTPPGKLVKMAEQLFFDTARHPQNGPHDEVVLFFEPRSEASRAAAARSHARIAERKEGRSPPIDAAWAAERLGSAPKNPVFPADGVLQMLRHTTTPVLHIGGDHDIIFPVENWYALNQQLPTLQLLTFPVSGHGPHHQYPELAATYIAAFTGASPVQ
jgi:pimeloyl-ACP methyl ester carboxylesterase